MPFTWTSRTVEHKAMVKAAIAQATAEVFQYDILSQAKQDSPTKTGTNRRSLDVDIIPDPKGTRAEMYSQSGYGGYLEIGTRRMKSQPYMLPAFKRWVNKITTRAREIING